MKLARIVSWLDGVLKPERFDDVSNNGIQIARQGEDVRKVAFAVDGSVRSVCAAVDAGSQLLVVHHGISWGGGIRRITDGAYNVVRSAMFGNLALYASHLPLDANRDVGNNWEIAREMRLAGIRPAFSYHGNVIGVVGTDPAGRRIGICSGGAGSFATEAKSLGCDLFVTGEADWGEVIAAENVGMAMECRGHYETETYGVRALMRAMKKALKVATVFVVLAMSVRAGAGEPAEASAGFPRWYVGGAAELVLPQGGSKMPRLGGGAARFGYYVTEAVAVEGAAAWMENRCGLSAWTLVHFRACEEYDRLFGYSALDPFVRLGVRGWMNDGQVGPAVGIGAMYYLSDSWALRCDAATALGLDTDLEMVYSLSAGVQLSF